MVERGTGKNESNGICASCGSLFSSEVFIEAVPVRDRAWARGAPESLGDYWVTFASNMRLPIKAQVWFRQGVLMLSFGRQEVPLSEVQSRITHHQVLVLPCAPKRYVEEGCTGSD